MRFHCKVSKTAQLTFLFVRFLIPNFATKVVNSEIDAFESYSLVFLVYFCSTWLKITSQNNWWFKITKSTYFYQRWYYSETTWEIYWMWHFAFCLAFGWSLGSECWWTEALSVHFCYCYRDDETFIIIPVLWFCISHIFIQYFFTHWAVYEKGVHWVWAKSDMFLDFRFWKWMNVELHFKNPNCKFFPKIAIWRNCKNFKI